MRYVVNARQPFLVMSLDHQSSGAAGGLAGPNDPVTTITTKARHCLVTPLISPLTHQGDRRVHPGSEPLPTITGANRGELALIAPTLINTRNGERDGQAPRVYDIQKPYPTVTAQGSQGALVAAFLARHYGGHENDGADLRIPMHTITAKDHHHLVAAFLLKYYSRTSERPLSEPMDTLSAKDHFGLVMVRGEPYQIADIGMRMLQPPELYKAQGFPPDIKLLGSKTSQVELCGNSVSPPVAAAIVRANMTESAAQERAA